MVDIDYFKYIFVLLLFAYFVWVLFIFSLPGDEIIKLGLR